jgi:hypothetical protein
MKSAFWMVFVSAALVPGLGAAADQSFLLPLPWSQEMAHHRGWGPEHPRMVADVDGDGRQDVVGFGRDGVWLGLSDGTSFDAALVLDQLGYLQGWRTDRHVRTVADVNGDGRADVVAFGNADVYVSLSTGSGFAFPAWAVPGFGYNQGWRVGEHVRALADVSGDGLDDIVGFGDDGVYLALATPSGVFSTPFYALEGFCSSQGWTAARHVRTLADVNGDGRHDIVGFGDHEVWIALSTGTGFATPQYAAPGFAYHNGSWRIELHRRLLADINRDGMADIVGFGDDGVWTAVSTGSGFAPAQRASVGFGANGGWTEPRHPRFVADLNGDGWQDLVGFGDEAVYRALGGPNGFAAIQPVLRAGGDAGLGHAEPAPLRRRRRWKRHGRPRRLRIRRHQGRQVERPSASTAPGGSFRGARHQRHDLDARHRVAGQQPRRAAVLRLASEVG